MSAQRDQLLEIMRSLRSCAVAFSGGVDSAVVAKAAAVALGERAVAVTGSSDSLAEGELEAARELAVLIGIRHVVVGTSEFSNSDYTRNASDRCYYCKNELYSQMARRMPEWNVDVILNGANVDDAADYRPGMQAAGEHAVRSPLAECGLGKAEVRQLAADWGLPVWDKPATPCLSSRVAYGEQVTPERLSMIDRAEQFLRDHGLGAVRVRLHRGELARVEVPIDALQRFMDSEFRQEFVSKLRSLGFKFVTLDLEGLRSGSLNQLLPVEQLKRL